MTSLTDIEKMLKSAIFLISAAKFAQCPTDHGHEIAFAGRSNAGKSSAINTLCQQKQLAKSSKTPGRTQLINFFTMTPPAGLDAEFNDIKLVDLPGYGYAKVARHLKESWQQELGIYIEERKNLKGIILLMDIRHPFSEFDSLLLEWALSRQMPIHVLLTKSDKLKRGAANASLYKVADQLTAMGGQFSVQLFSALKKEGVEDAYQIIGELFGLLEELPD